MRTHKRCSTSLHTKQGGFTIIELMAVIALVSVLIAMAGPSFTGAIDRSKIRSTTADLIASLNAARGKALGQNRQVMVLPFAGTVNWHAVSGTTHPNGGWCVMAANTTTPQTTCVTSTAYPMYEQHDVDKNVTVVSTVNSLTFDGVGASKAAAIVTFTVCKKGWTGNTVTVGLGGRITTDPTAAVCP